MKSVDFEFRIEYEYTYQQLKGNRSISVLEGNNCAYLVLHVDGESDGYKFLFEFLNVSDCVRKAIFDLQSYSSYYKSYVDEIPYFEPNELNFRS